LRQRYLDLEILRRRDDQVHSKQLSDQEDQRLQLTHPEALKEMMKTTSFARFE
jgi:hypothetical protein